METTPAHLPPRPPLFGLFLGLIWFSVSLDWLLWAWQVKEAGWLAASSGKSLMLIVALVPPTFRTGLAVLLWVKLRQRRNWARVVMMVLQVLSFGTAVFVFLTGGWERSGDFPLSARFSLACGLATSILHVWNLYYLNRGDVRAWFTPKV